jgi:hypothetical protein
VTLPNCKKAHNGLGETFAEPLEVMRSSKFLRVAKQR